jgi:hypothetical protein
MSSIGRNARVAKRRAVQINPIFLGVTTLYTRSYTRYHVEKMADPLRADRP